MTSLLQTLSSIRHRPGRTFLTALGTALGIATIVALLAVGAGAQRSAAQFFHLGASDLGLFQKDAADPTTSVLPQSLIKHLRKTPGIRSATGFVLLVSDVPHNPGVVVFGSTPSNFEVNRMVFSSGHMFRRNAPGGHRQRDRQATAPRRRRHAARQGPQAQGRRDLPPWRRVPGHRCVHPAAGRAVDRRPPERGHDDPDRAVGRNPPVDDEAAAGQALPRGRDHRRRRGVDPARRQR